jgi:uncharacterized protein YceH (UPF0502 family)
MNLSAIEQRVLGALIEKEMATPEYYPLSLNALVNACNQKNNREPVMHLGEAEVLNAIEVMRHQGLAYEHSGREHRVPKYSQGLGQKLNLGNKELAILCVLLCRGPQTPGEIRSRSQSLYSFEDLDTVLSTLGRMTNLVKELPRGRWIHTLGNVEVPALPATPASLEERVKALEDFVEQLKVQLGLG